MCCCSRDEVRAGGEEESKGMLTIPLPRDNSAALKVVLSSLISIVKITLF